MRSEIGRHGAHRVERDRARSPPLRGRGLTPEPLPDILGALRDGEETISPRVLTRRQEGVKIEGSPGKSGGEVHGPAGETVGLSWWEGARASLAELVLTTRVLGVRGEEMAPSGPAEATRPLVEGPELVWGGINVKF